jgi:hypothetical protein
VTPALVERDTDSTGVHGDADEQFVVAASAEASPGARVRGRGRGRGRGRTPSRPSTRS